MDDKKAGYETVVYELNQQIAFFNGGKRVQSGSTIYVDDRNVPYKVVNVTIEGKRQIVDVTRE